MAHPRLSTSFSRTATSKSPSSSSSEKLDAKSASCCVIASIVRPPVAQSRHSFPAHFPLAYPARCRARLARGLDRTPAADQFLFQNRAELWPPFESLLAEHWVGI